VPVRRRRDPLTMIIATLLLGAMTLLVFVDDGPSRD
jgi:hypothetical protein